MSDLFSDQFFSQSTSGHNIFENLRETEKPNGRMHMSDIHSRNSRNLKHNSSTQTDLYSGEAGSERRKQRADSEERKTFSGSSLHPSTLCPRYGPSAFQEICYTRAEPSLPDCTSLEPMSETKHSGGTWPKMMVGVTAESSAQLSIYKSPKQRKSIFDIDMFKIPDAPSKMEYLSSHSPQPSKTDCTATPPTPPARSDSFKFKPKHQGSSASDSTITDSQQEECNGNLCFTEVGHEGRMLSSRKSCEEDIGRARPDEPEVKRPRPKSAPALRRRMTPQLITLPSFQVHLEVHLCSFISLIYCI